MARAVRQLALLSAFVLVADAQLVQAADTSFGSGATLLAQGLPGLPTAPVLTPQPSSTILPTDVLPLPQVQNRMTFAENLQLRILQKLPSRFYFTSSTETSFRLETNPFQFPTKRVFERQLFPPGTPSFNRFPLASQQNILNLLKRPSSGDVVFRVLPNVTAGLTVTPHTRVYINYFMIRDSLMRNVKLNTNIESISWGAQHDFTLGNRLNLQADVQARELFQTSSFYGTHNLQGGTSNVHPIFDFLPGLTLSYVATPRTVLFANTLLQLRSREYFTAPRAEIDPFYTWGMMHQRGRWSFSASSTFVENFRGPFHHPIFSRTNNYSMISDFEVARRIIAQLPGLQAFVRAEPIWNMHSHNRPGLAGMDFRLFWGLRFSVTKPSLTAGLEQLKQQIQEQEVEPPSRTPEQPKPSAFLQPYQVIASSRQPIHGLISTAQANLDPIHPALKLDEYLKRSTPVVASADLSAPVSFRTILPLTEGEAAPNKAFTHTEERKSPVNAPVAKAEPSRAFSAITKEAEPELKFIVRSAAPAEDAKNAEATKPVFFMPM